MGKAAEMAMSPGPSAYKAWEIFGLGLEYDNSKRLKMACLGCRTCIVISSSESKALREGIREVFAHIDQCAAWAEREELWKVGVRKMGEGPTSVEVLSSSTAGEMAFAARYGEMASAEMLRSRAKVTVIDMAEKPAVKVLSEDPYL